MDWKNPVDVSVWRATRKQNLEKVWGKNFAPLLMGLSLAADRREPGELVPGTCLELLQQTGESLTERARRLENQGDSQHATRRAWSVPYLVGVNDAGTVIFSAPGQRASDWKRRKGVPMVHADLLKKANRELACGLVGGPVKCKNGHQFHVAYECGNRYCPKCGPEGAKKLFARTLGPLRLAAARLLLCDNAACAECFWWRQGMDRAGDNLPHWPPQKNRRHPKTVVAILDFTLRNIGGSERSLREGFRFLNSRIKTFMRTLERRRGIARAEYGLLWCDELGRNNSNMHAHGIYVGPWLPQKKRELSELWKEVTGGMGEIVFIRFAESLERALYHAMKYPAKYADEEKTSPERAAALEMIFHRVRRIHALASFYNMKKPDDPSGDVFNTCPLCSEQLSKPDFRFLLADLKAVGSRDVTALQREILRARVLQGEGGGSSP